MRWVLSTGAGLNIIVPFNRSEPWDECQLDLVACPARTAEILDACGGLASPAKVSAHSGCEPPSCGATDRLVASLTGKAWISRENGDNYFVHWATSRRRRSKDFRLMLEAFEKLRGFTSFGRDPADSLLEEACRTEFCSPEMNRRRQLIRMRRGSQTGPEPNPLVVKYRTDNLNPWFWSGYMPSP